MSLVNKRFVPKETVERWVNFMESRYPGRYPREDLVGFACGALKEAGVGIGKPIREKNAKSGRAHFHLHDERKEKTRAVETKRKRIET